MNINWDTLEDTPKESWANLSDEEKHYISTATEVSEDWITVECFLCDCHTRNWYGEIHDNNCVLYTYPNKLAKTYNHPDPVN